MRHLVFSLVLICAAGLAAAFDIEDRARFRPADTLREMAREKRRFYPEG